MAVYSDALLNAQALLQKCRQAHQPSAHNAPGFANGGKYSNPTADIVSALPRHLGWMSTAVSRHLHQKSQNATPSKTGNLAVTTSAAASQSQAPLPKAQTIRHYPDIGIAALNKKQAPHYLLWLGCRLLDKAGRGWLQLSALQQQFTCKESSLRLFGKRRLRQVLQAGNGRLWTIDRQRHRIWLAGAGRVAKLLNVPRLTGHPVLLPISALTQGIGTFKAHLYTAWHSGRRTPNPISRETQETVLGIPSRTQRHYEQKTAVQIISNWAVGAPYTAENLELQAWQHGKSIFQLTDKQGRLGKRNGRYIAWQLPNQYIGPHQQAPLGRQRLINHQLADLAHKGAQGNSEMRLTRRFFSNGADAARSVEGDTKQPAYWPLRQYSNNHHHGKRLWSFF